VNVPSRWVVAVEIDGRRNELVVEAVNAECARAGLREDYTAPTKAALMSAAQDVFTYPTREGSEVHVRWAKVGTVRLVSIEPHTGRRGPGACSDK
jgi:hypothetical protein